MFLIDRASGDLVRVEQLEDLLNPLQGEVWARDQAGEEEQDPTTFSKRQLLFPSGERLPRCWLDSNYRNTGTAPMQDAN